MDSDFEKILMEEKLIKINAIKYYSVVLSRKGPQLITVWLMIPLLYSVLKTYPYDDSVFSI